MALPPEKVAELKQIIHTQLAQMDVEKHIREVMDDITGDEQMMDHVTEEEMIEKLRNRGVVDEIMSHLHFSGGAQPLRPATHLVDQDNLNHGAVRRANIDPTRRYLYLKIRGGKAFMDQLAEEDTGQASSASFTLHLHFRGQRFKSRPAPCAVEPSFDEGFLLELHKEGAGDAGKMADVGSMLSICDPIHIVLIRTTPMGESTLVSSNFFEWRPLLTAKHGHLPVSIELKGTGPESKVPIGILEADLELFPRSGQVLEENVVRTQLDLERGRQAEQDRRFLEYAKHWWREYLDIKPAHQDRLIKIFALDENSNYRPVCSYVTPLRAGRLLDSPRQAMRFVSLVRYDREMKLGGGDKLEQWSSLHAFLARNKGDCEDHATLLCSLLLGFGLDAYVCIGTKAKSAVHAWVMTISTDGLVTFWESLNGHRFVHEPVDPMAPPMGKRERASYPYKTIGSVFNHRSFYANTQASDRVEECRFDLQNGALWKNMSAEVLLSVCGPGASPHWPSPPPLVASALDATLASNDLEIQVRRLVAQHRQDQGLSTTWDDQLSYILTPALAAYETERVTGVTAGNEEFQDAVRQAVPDGQTFKGYPIQFTHRSPRKAFLTCLKAPICEEIINCRGDQVRLALRVRIFPYPESACAVWMMFACKYKSVL
ncbi:hypothetical protein BaRGS_00027059 [Batillaria attramentaria]|uniref:Centrosomal protein of 76 kDa n=1 Tax=Batillaria attramentaria TaxID=370345 RepID=A0ABD0K2Z9_9CAEN